MATRHHLSDLVVARSLRGKRVDWAARSSRVSSRCAARRSRRAGRARGDDALATGFRVQRSAGSSSATSRRRSPTRGMTSSTSSRIPRASSGSPRPSSSWAAGARRSGCRQAPLEDPDLVVVAILGVTALAGLVGHERLPHVERLANPRTSGGRSGDLRHARPRDDHQRSSRCRSASRPRSTSRSTRAPNRFTNFVRLNIRNLAGVPSVVYGLLGLALFVQLMGTDSADGPVDRRLLTDVFGEGGITGGKTMIAGGPRPLDPRAADRDHHLVGSDPGGAAVSCARVATGWARRSGKSRRRLVLPNAFVGHPDRHDPLAVAGDRGDGAADPRRRVLRHLLHDGQCELLREVRHDLHGAAAGHLPVGRVSRSTSSR